MPVARRKRENQDSEPADKRIKQDDDAKTSIDHMDRLAIKLCTARPRKVNGTSKDPELDLEWLMQHPKSKLKDKDLSDYINYETWLDFSDEEKASLLRLLPDVDKLAGDIDPSFFSHNQFLQSAFVDFQDALYNGQYTVEFEHILATERAKETTDAWKDEQFEEYWGQKYDAMTRGLAGDSSAVKISDMAKHGLLRIGDVWRLIRPVYSVKIQAEATVTDISPSFGLTFSYDPTKAIVMPSEERETKSVKQNGDGNGNIKTHVKKTAIHDATDITSPTTLETHILKVTPGIPDKWPNGNAFKSIRVLRNGIDEGSLFSMRLEWFNDGCPVVRVNGESRPEQQHGKVPKKTLAEEEFDDDIAPEHEYVPSATTTRSGRKSGRK